VTQTARLVLEDVEYALSKHRDTLQANAFRVSWFAVIGLLRTVGHALDKVDGETSVPMRRAIQEKYKLLKSSEPKPAIFWEFIEGMRNELLKEYELGVKRTLTGYNADKSQVMMIVDVGSGRGKYGAEDEAGFNNRIDFVSRISTGTFAGRSEREVAEEAVIWWKQYLDEIDTLVAKYAPAS
jgi:hypothetical protein